MQEISVKEIKRYDFIRTKKYVDDLLFNLKHYSMKLLCLLPPGANVKVDLIDKVQESRTNTSKIEKYIEKKDYLEPMIKEELNKISNSIKLMTENEKTMFEELYIYQNTEFDISEKYGWSRSKVVHLKKSFIIKIALSKGMDYEK